MIVNTIPLGPAASGPPLFFLSVPRLFVKGRQFSILEGILAVPRDGLRRGHERDVVDAGVHPCCRHVLLVVELVAPLAQPGVALGAGVDLAAIARRVGRAVATCVRRHLALDHSEERAQGG